MILKELGLDLVSLLAGAGCGFAVGFGAQELIKDIIVGCSYFRTYF